MAVSYDTYYQTRNLFGKPYPELIEFFTKYSKDHTILDLGCGQGRDAIPLAQLGFTVTGIDNSKVGIEQMNQIAKDENLSLTGKVADIYEFDHFKDYDFVLLDSMFHFAKNDLDKETKFIKRIIDNVKKGCLIIFCIQDTGKKVKILNETLDIIEKRERIADKKFYYTFEDNQSGHQSKSDYRMIVIKK